MAGAFNGAGFLIGFNTVDRPLSRDDHKRLATAASNWAIYLLKTFMMQNTYHRLLLLLHCCFTSTVNI